MGGMSNPLLHFEGLPLWDQVRPEHVGPAMDELLARADQALAQVTQPDFPADWNAIARALDVATDRLGRAWGMVGHLNAVADTPELRAAYNEALPEQFPKPAELVGMVLSWGGEAAGVDKALPLDVVDRR